MPPKTIKTETARKVTVKAVLLANGNLLIPQRMGHDRTIADWLEITPDAKEYKTWMPVASSEPDPRLQATYIAWKAEIVASPEYSEWQSKQISVLPQLP